MIGTALTANMPKFEFNPEEYEKMTGKKFDLAALRREQDRLMELDDEEFIKQSKSSFEGKKEEGKKEEMRRYKISCQATVSYIYYLNFNPANRNVRKLEFNMQHLDIFFKNGYTETFEPDEVDCDFDKTYYLYGEGKDGTDVEIGCDDNDYDSDDWKEANDDNKN